MFDAQRTHPLVARPWGTYHVLLDSDRYQIKRSVLTYSPS